jgi:hypothetical protein
VKKRPVSAASVAKLPAPRKVEQRPVARRGEPARGLGHLEARSGLGDDHLALEHHAEAEADRETVRRGDHRLPVDRPREEVGRVGAPALRAAVLLQVFVAAQLALVHVGAAREGAAVAAQHRHVGGLVDVELVQHAASRITIASLKALSFSGRLNVIVAIRSLHSYWTKASLLGSDIAADLLLVGTQRVVLQSRSTRRCSSARGLP